MTDKATTFLLTYWPFLAVAVAVAFVVLTRTGRAGALFALRFISRPLLLIAVIALVYDGTRTIAGPGRITVTSLLEHTTTIAPKAVETVQRRIPPIVWEQGVQRVLRLPAWLVLGALGLGLAWLGRRRQRIDVFIN
ncbi:MAG TPA: hypothetical protein PK264_09185 [Hyphomicrobiaceae bacterium]|nr:hypothetical protein [Hyphomicrobiaceae bacterium]